MNKKGKTFRLRSKSTRSAQRERSGRKNEPPPPANQQPLFGDEFLRLLSDYGYETLRSYLERSHAKREAVHLLDSLIVLTYCVPQPKKVTGIDNQIVSETVGAISKDIVALGGVYVGPMGEIVSKG